jgi:cytochrome P450
VDQDQLSPDVQAAVDAALKDVDTKCAADAELVRGDVVEELAAGLPLEVAVALCEQDMDFVPDTVRWRMFAADNEESFQKSAIRSAERDAAEAKSKQRSQRAAATRASTVAAEVAAQTTVMRSRTCPDCFTVRAPSGACACE